MRASISGEILAALRPWLIQRRWFATKHDTITEINVLAATALGPELTHAIVRVHSNDRSDLYQLFLATGTRDHVDLHVHPEHVIHIGERVTYEAFGDQSALLVLLQHFIDQARVADLEFHSSGELTSAHTARVISGEQSNSSVIFGDQAIAKFYRRILPGLNPDLEIGLALDQIGARHIPRLLGWMSGAVEGQVTTFAVAHQFLYTAVDGFEHALSSVRDLIASPELSPHDAGGDFTAEAVRLGEAVAEVHLALAEAFGSTTMTDADTRALAAAMNRRLDDALQITSQLGAYESGLREIFASIEAMEIPLQRIHGDLHLGQVLRDPTGWVVLDFEGEPGMPLSERRQTAPALRDVAGMLRSFDYAARQPLIAHPHAEANLPRTAEWARANRAAFLRGYLAVSPIDIDAAGPLMRALEADKAIYEAVYEQRFRPDWIGVPLGGIERLVEGR